MTRESIIEAVKESTKNYLQESGEEDISIPTSLLDFIFDYAVEICHFPNHFTDEQILGVLNRNKYTLAMMCQEVYAKGEIPGEKQHSENGVVRVYDRAWISDTLINALPNYVNTPSTLRI